MSEADLQRLVLELCKRLDLPAYHTYDSRRCEPGFPDLVIVGRTILYRELKSATGTVTAEQRFWQSRIKAAGGDWDLWRPADWRSMRVFKELTGIAL